MKRNFTLFLFLIAICSVANAQTFTTEWSRSVASGAVPEWFGSYTERGIAATSEYVYVATRNTEAGKGLKYMDAKTGADLGDLNVEAVADGGFLLNDVETSADGQILACNLALYHEQWVPNGSWTFKIYKWADNNAEPEVLINYDNPNQLRMGDSFTVKGDLTANAIIYVPVYNSNVVLRWEVVDGTLNETPEVLTLPELTNNKGSQNVSAPGTFPKVIPMGVTKDDPFIYNALAIFPALYSADGTVKQDELNAGNFTTSTQLAWADESSGVTFEANGRTYFAAISNMQMTEDNNTEVKAVDITEGLSQATGLFYSDPLGVATNNQRNSDIATAVIDGEIYVYALYTNAGFAAFKLDPTAIDVPVTETGWRRARLDSINGVPTLPAWCDDMARTFAYGNGHLYVARCAENNVPGEIIILDAADGSNTYKKLNVDPLNEANDIEHQYTIRISDVEVDDAGHILACNVRLTGKPFSIFAWDDEDSEPYKLVEVTPPYGNEASGAAWQQTAYYLDVKGDIKGDAVIIAGRSNYGSVYKWVIKDGTVQNDGNPYVVLYSDSNYPGAYASAAIESASEDANIWIDGDKITPTQIDKDGNVLSVMPDLVASPGNDANKKTAVKFVTMGDKKFVLEWNWNWTDHTRLIDVTSNPVDSAEWVNVDTQQPGSWMGFEPSSFRLGDVDYYVDGNYLNIFTLSPGNGIKMDRVFFEPEEIDVPVTETGWRRASRDSINGVSTIPYWLDGTSRAVAYGNEHIYVVNCADGDAAGEILILDAKDGSKLDKKLNVAPVNAANSFPGEAGNVRISDVEVDDAGHILACNLRLQGVPLSIFAWDDEDSEPYKLVEFMVPSWWQTAYYFDVKGDIKGDAVIIVARSNQAITYKWVIKGGVVQNNGAPYEQTYTWPDNTGGSTNWGVYASAALESADENSNIWVKAGNINPVSYDSEGNIIGQIPADVATITGSGTTPRIAVKYLEYAGKKFLLEWNWVWADHTRLIDISGDLMALTSDNAEEIGSYLGQAPNPLHWGDVDYFIENDTLNIITLATNNGIKLDKYYLTPTAAEVITNHKDISVYPNPAKNQITVAHPDGCERVEFFNLLGASVKVVVDVTNSPIDISDLNNGVYLLRITPNSGSTQVKKIIKQ